MWFITEVLPGIVAFVIILVLAIQNFALRKMLQEAQNTLARKEATGTALALMQISQLVEVATQRLQAGFVRDKSSNPSQET